MIKSFYELLAVTPDATAEEVRVAIEKAGRKTRSDELSDEKEASKHAQLLKIAARVLGDPQERRRYDSQLDRLGPAKANDAFIKSELATAKKNSQRQFSSLHKKTAAPDPVSMSPAIEKKNEAMRASADGPSPGLAPTTTERKKSPRLKTRGNSPVLKSVIMIGTIVTGGVSAVCVALVALWLMGKDPTGVFSESQQNAEHRVADANSTRPNSTPDPTPSNPAPQDSKEGDVADSGSPTSAEETVIASDVDPSTKGSSEIHPPADLQDGDADTDTAAWEPEITIDHAEFGTGRAKANCAAQVREILQDKNAITNISTPGLKLRNRRGLFRNELRITYRADGGEASTLHIPNGKNVNLYHAILEHAREHSRRPTPAPQPEPTRETASMPAPTPPRTPTPAPVPVPVPVPVKPDATPKPISGADAGVASIPLPGKITRVRTGGSGRFLICQIEGQTSLWVIDLSEKRIAGKVPITDGAVFAAGKTKLLVGLPQTNQLQKWDLATLKREATATLDSNAPPGLAVMGSASEGPLVLWSDGAIARWDIATLKPLKSQGIQVGSVDRGVGLTVSADGKTLCGWTTNLSGQRFNVIRFNGEDATVSKTESHSMGHRWAMPNPDGSLLFRYGGAAYAFDLKPIPTERFKSQVLLPTTDERFILALKEAGKGKFEVTLCTVADFQPLVAVGVFEVCSGRVRTTRGRLEMEPAIRYLPQSKLFVSIPDSRDSIRFVDFDLDEALKSKGTPYLRAASRPHPVALAGETFEYQIQVVTDSDDVSYRLDAGPERMTVSSSGKVQWPVSGIPKDGVANVAVSISTAQGQSATHAFRLIVPDHQKTKFTDSPAAARPSTDPALVGTYQVMKFDESFTQSCYGGGGRFLVLHFADLEKIRILDLLKRTITASIKVPNDARFAANQDSLIVVFPEKNTLESWSLESGEKQKSSTYESAAKPTVVAMGAGGNGPLAMWGDGEVQLFDAQDLKPIPPNGSRLSAKSSDGFEMSVSADGKTFCGWQTKSSNQPFGVMRFDDGFTTLTNTPDRHGMNHRWIMPTANSRRFLRYGRQGYSYDLKLFESSKPEPGKLFPTNDPRFAISWTRTDQTQCQLTLFSTTSLLPITTLGDFETHSDREPFPRPCRINSSPRFDFFAEANLVCYLPTTNDQVVLRTVDVEKALAESNPNYLVVTSSPAPVAYVGEKFTYQMTTLSASKDVKYSIESAPKGFAVSEDGKVSWPVDARPPGGVVSVVIKAESTGGSSVTHPFDLSVKRRIDRNVKPGSTIQVPSSVGFVPIDDYRLELPGDVTSVTTGIDGRHMLLCNRFLVVLGSDGWTVEQLHLLDEDYLKIDERKNHYVAISNTPAAVHVLNKETLKVEKSVELPCIDVIDLAVHPTLPMSYISMHKSFDVPGSMFVVFNEETGKAKSNDDWIGNFLVVDASGKHLFVGYKDRYRKGSRLIMNPNRWHVTPEYGSLDWLIRYDVDRRGMPSYSELNTDVGKNGKGISISADGRRIVYLSFTGHPGYSKNLSGWNPQDLSLIPTRYRTSDVASCQSFVFHPTLPIAASPGTNSISVFDQESGQVLDDRIPADQPEVATTRESQLYFSQDGKHLVALGEINGIHYLQKVNLKLTRRELKRAQVRTKTSPKRRLPAEIRLGQIEALAGGYREEIEFAEIARRFNQSVLVVRSGDRSGSAFVVGSAGYFLTCAHCVEDGQDIELSQIDSRGKRQTYNASLVVEDRERDIALLKVKGDHTFEPVRLGVGHVVEMGTRVSVIGNPVVDGRVLDQTMTEGIVSNPRRQISEVEHIQISAAINSGNSGGPVFDSQGNVCGLVVSRAEIDDAGFAVSANELAHFLMSHPPKAADLAANAIERSWYDADGQGPLVATLLNATKTSIHLRRQSDGREYELEIDQLSAEDQAFLKIFQTHRNRSDEASAGGDSTG